MGVGRHGFLLIARLQSGKLKNVPSMYLTEMSFLLTIPEAGEWLIVPGQTGLHSKTHTPNLKMIKMRKYNHIKKKKTEKQSSVSGSRPQAFRCA